MPGYHTPVLLEESVALLGVRPEGTYVDLTFGGGGHTRRILEELGLRGDSMPSTRMPTPQPTGPTTAGCT